MYVLALSYNQCYNIPLIHIVEVLHYYNIVFIGCLQNGLGPTSLFIPSGIGINRLLSASYYCYTPLSLQRKKYVMSSIYVFTTYIRRGATCSSVTYILVNNYMYISENALLLPIRCCLFYVDFSKMRKQESLGFTYNTSCYNNRMFFIFCLKVSRVQFFIRNFASFLFSYKNRGRQQQYHLQSSFTMQKCTHYSTTSFK